MGLNLDDSKKTSVCVNDSVMMVNGGKSKEEGKHKKRKNQQVTSRNVVMKRLLRPARYFDVLMTNPFCNPTKPPRKPCLICASFQHVTKHCAVNHLDKDCSDKTSVCLRCGGLGHDMGMCKYEYTEDDLKNVQCYVCKSFGHMCCVQPPPSLWAVSCYRCGQLGHTGLSCGRHFDGKPDIQSGFGHVKEAEKKKRRIEKKKKKKQRRLDEKGVAIAIEDSTHREFNEKRERETTTLSSLIKNYMNSEEKSIPHESNWTMTKKKRKQKRKKNKKNSEQHVTANESNGEKYDGNLEQNFTAHESNRKRRKNKKAKDEQPPIAEKPNLRSGWRTKDSEENPFQRGKIRRLSSTTTPSGHDHHILPVSPQGHNHRLPTTHIGHNYGSPRFISGGHYPGSNSTTAYDRDHINSLFESNGHLSGPPPSRLWQRNYLPSFPIAPLDRSHRQLPVTPPGHNNRSPTFSSSGHYTGSLSTVPCGGNHRYSSFESNGHLLDPPFSRPRQSYYFPTSPIAPSGHNHHLLPVIPPGHNHRSPTFSSGEHHTGSLSTIPPHGGYHRDSSFEYNGRQLDPPFSSWQPYYHPTSPITRPGHNHHMLLSTYLDRNHMLSSAYKGHNQRSPTFHSGGHYSSPLSSTQYGGNHRNSPFESDGYPSGPSMASSGYGPAHHYGEFSGNYERW